MKDDGWGTESVLDYLQGEKMDEPVQAKKESVGVLEKCHEELDSLFRALEVLRIKVDPVVTPSPEKLVDLDETSRNRLHEVELRIRKASQTLNSIIYEIDI